MKKFLSLLFLLTSLFAISKENILALSWESSFCKIKPYDKTCINLRRTNTKIHYFLLHGLWPKRKNYCSTYYKFELSFQIKKILQKYMPSISLAKHEWKKHGSCFGSDANTYFLTAIKLTQQFNETSFLTFVRTHLDRYVSLEKIRFVFSQIFGTKNKRKFQLICKRKNGINYIVEIRLNLKGDPTKLGLYELINNAKDFIGVRQCKGGIFAF